MDSRFSLRWNNYTSQLTEAFSSLLLTEDLVDVTLSCEGKKIKAHKILLSACSTYFHDIFKENPCQHPVIVFKNVKSEDLLAIIEFIYNGEVKVMQDQLESFLNTAALLEVKGLTNKENETEEISRAEVMDGEDFQTSPVGKQQIISAKTQDTGETSEICATKSPPAKRRKTNVEENPVESNSSIDDVTIKKETEEVEILYEKCIKSQTPESNLSPQHGVHMTLKHDVETHEKPSNENIEECLSVDDESSTQDTCSDSEPKISFPVKKPNKIKEEILSEGEASYKSGKKTPEVMSVPASATKPVGNPKIRDKGKVQLPKDLIVIPIKDASQVKDLFDYPAQQVQVETYQALRSEDATTPIHEEPLSSPQDVPGENVPLQNNSDVEPEVAEEAPVLQEQTELENLVQDEPTEPEFDYFGCEICKSEAKPVDLDRITFNHKCPICPCCCFCAHLLKDHMKVIHGWFNVQRRFTHY